MPTIPKIVTLTNSSVDVLNAIRNSATQNYKDYVPKATADADSIREIGAIIMDYPSLQNEFVSALVNRIGRVLITSKMFTNPFKMFKKGLLEFGETVEEIFVNIAKPFQFDPNGAQNTVFKREIPDVKSAFHIMNYQKYYKTTIQNDQLRQAFLSWQGVTDLIAKIVDSMYSGAEYDEFQTFKYMMAKHILNGQMYPVEVAAVTTANMKSIVADIKGISNDMEFMKTKYNLTGVKTKTMKNEQYILVNTKFDAVMDVEVLASAFNMDKAQFMGQRVLIDSFGGLDNERLAILFADDPNYVPLTDAELTALDAIPAIIVDKDWFMVFDNYQNFTEQYNGEGLYWNYWYHVWKTFSVSPFANNAMFIPATPTVTSITLTPATATLAVGQSLQLTAEVVTANFAPKTVNWTINSEKSTIDNSGKLTIGATEDAVSITVTATSTYDGTKTGTATITVA
jgi:hypothetical protein